MSIASNHSLQHFSKLNQGLGSQMQQGTNEMYGQTTGSSNSNNMAAILGRRTSISGPIQSQQTIAEQARKNSVYQSLLNKDSDAIKEIGDNSNKQAINQIESIKNLVNQAAAA